MYRSDQLCQSFAQILQGPGKFQNGVCSVSLRRTFSVTVQGYPSSGLPGVDVWFEALMADGKALNFGEVAVLQSEVPGFNAALAQQGIAVSAIHNHWILTDPEILYIHFQSIEPPLAFARKVAHAFTALSSYPIP